MCHPHPPTEVKKSNMLIFFQIGPSREAQNWAEEANPCQHYVIKVKISVSCFRLKWDWQTLSLCHVVIILSFVLRERVSSQSEWQPRRRLLCGKSKDSKNTVAGRMPPQQQQQAQGVRRRPQLPMEQRNFLILEYHKRKDNYRFMDVLLADFQTTFPGSRVPAKR